MEFSIKLLNKLMDLRYSKQPKLKEIKAKLLTRQIKYREMVNQDYRIKDNNTLDKLDKKRWSRQLSHGLINQKRIKDARIVVFGVGGIGSNVLMGLIYSGVHNFKVIDYDIVKLSNLNRQTLYVPSDIGSLKIEKAEERLLNINPNISIESYNIKIDYPKELNVLNLKEKEFNDDITKINDLIKWGDIIVNTLDFQGAPYLINDLCVINRKPYYWGGVNHFLGEIYSFYPKNNAACLRCIFGRSDFINKSQFLRYKEKEKNLSKGINVGATVIGTGNIISEMIIHDICGIDTFSHGHYIIYDAYEFKIKEIPIEIDNDCQCLDFNKNCMLNRKSKSILLNFL